MQLYVWIFIIIIFLWLCLENIKNKLYFQPSKGRGPKIVVPHIQDFRLLVNNKEEIDVLAFRHSNITNNKHFNVKQYVILYCHGNAGNITNRIKIAEIFYDNGYDMVMFDYRGYGSSDGSPSEKNCYQDASHVYLWLLENGYQKDQIIVLGESIGSGVATYIADKHEIKYLVLKNGFTSIAEVFQNFAWILQYLCPEFPSYKNLKSFKQKCPDAKILVYHTIDDNLISIAHGKTLAKKATISSLSDHGGHNIHPQCLLPHLKKLLNS